MSTILFQLKALANGIEPETGDRLDYEGMQRTAAFIGEQFEARERELSVLLTILERVNIRLSKLEAKTDLLEALINKDNP